MTLTRRELLQRSAAGAGVIAFGNLSSLVAASPVGAAAGPLVADPNHLLDLPAGFSYTVVSRAGDLLPSGGITPDAFDGTGVFAKSGGAIHMVRNSELGTSDPLPAVAAPELTYDSGCVGGTTTLVLGAGQQPTEGYVSLAGTSSNCAGGITPWDTRLTCEETEAKIGGALTKNHGYVFEVDPYHPENNVDPTPLTALGRFAHEAAAIDPLTGTVYLTEDASSPNGLVYRCVPNSPLGGYGSLRDGGTLAAMRCSNRGTHVADLAVFTKPGTVLDVTWVPVPDPTALTLTSIRKQFDYAGTGSTPGGPITRSRKFEGLWWGDGRVYIVCSFARFSDGSDLEHDGQVWSYDPVKRQLRLEVRFAVNTDTASDRPDGPDNITVSPFGGLFLAEDGNGVQHLLVVDKQGVTSPFARNARDADDASEFTGVCFAPGGQVMFANLQRPGVTFAITGPFKSLK